VGKFTALPRLLTGLRGLLLRGGKGKGKEWKRRGKE